MTALIFLLAVVALSLLGALTLWLRERGPRSMEAHMRAFARQREALAPDSVPLPPGRAAAGPPVAPAVTVVKDRRSG